MKILIVGSEKKWAIENFYVKYLRALGVNVITFPAHDCFDDYYHRSIINKIIVRANLSNIYKRINQDLINIVQQQHINIIWIFKGMEIFPSTLALLKETGVKLINYNPDHPFIHTSRGSGNSFVRNGVKYYDAHFCYNLPVLRKIEKEYSITCRWLPFAYEPSLFEYPSVESEIVKACFIGNPDKFRASKIKKIAGEKIRVDVYGNNWKDYLDESEYICIFPPIYKSDFNRIAPKYRLHLNIFRPHNDNSHNMRTFEMPGLGCIVLAPDSLEHRKLFRENSEIFLYNNDDVLVGKARYVLGLTFDEAMLLRKAAYRRVVESGYSYKDRSQEVFKWVDELVSNGYLGRIDYNL